MSRINRLTITGFAIGIALSAGAGALAAHADTTDPVEPPIATIFVDADSSCGGIALGWTVPDNAEWSLWRANVTPDPDGAEPAPVWVPVEPDQLTYGSRDYPEPHGDTYLYRLDVDTNRDEPGPEISIMSDRVTSYACTTTTPTPGPTPSPSPSPSSSADPSPSAPVSPSDGTTPTPDTPAPERNGGLANTGV